MMDNGWRDALKNPPPALDRFRWYAVLYKDGSIGNACWWVTHWYCCPRWADITHWRYNENHIMNNI